MKWLKTEAEIHDMSDWRQRIQQGNPQ